MADLDEEAINQPSPSSARDGGGQVDQDISDETQDFRFLSSFATFTDSTQPQTLPRRGEKDFEPNPTLHQTNILTSSRNAMHHALAYPRLHNPKTRIIGFYVPDGFRGDACVCVPNQRGQHFRTMAQADQFNRMWLLPEEALYMLERGTLDIRWASEEVKQALKTGGKLAANPVFDADQSIPMSLQAAYACFIGKTGLSLERYLVFAGLRRGGYSVIRASGRENTTTDCSKFTEPKKHEVSKPWGVIGIISRIFSSLFSPQNTYDIARGPIIGLGIHRSYRDIYQAISIIPTHDPNTPDHEIQRHEIPPSSPYQVAFHVYKPSTPFKKSNPGPPDFRLAVIDARTHPIVPTLEELSNLLETTPLDPPQGEKMDRLLYMRLRHGFRNVILAIVDQGVISYLRISDSGFIKNPLYDQAGHNHAKHKGGRRPAAKKR
ncbi:tRNA-splicing endonuclease subunit sen54 [Myotisia sp. PD_48]|nr:tRNA-splicing endonuclease subunit sen54 [Myotisia sp. PD_48]